MKKILMITTGGTIPSVPTSEGLAPSEDNTMVQNVLMNFHEQYDISVRDLMHLDSSNMQPEEWQFIARCIAETHVDYDGIVLTHGTDTMAYTASALSYMLLNLPIPVVLTGSQLPLNHPFTDGVDNLRCALAMAASGRPGVYVAFNRKIILGVRAVKVRTTGFDAFESVNAPYAAYLDASGLNINRYALPSLSGLFSPSFDLCDQVALVKLIPGFNPQFFDLLSKINCRAVVVEAFGAGGLHFIRRNLVDRLSAMLERGMCVVVCSQCLYEKSDFSIYQSGQKALQQGVIEGLDMTSEAAVTKLMWALGQTQDPERVRRMFQTNYANEITL